MYTYLHIPRMMLCLFEESLERKASPGSFDIWTKKNTQDTYIDTHKNTYKNTCSGHADIAVGGAGLLSLSLSPCVNVCVCTHTYMHIYVCVRVCLT